MSVPLNLSVFIEIGLLCVCALLALPCVVFFVECVAALLPAGPKRPASERSPRIAVLVPAHNEAGGIGDTVRALTPELGEHDRLLVIADNCTDATARFAREAGAEVAERTNPDQRGKGYALGFGADQLSADPPDVVVAVDADCRVSKGAVQTVARAAFELDRPVQAEFLMQAAGKDPRSVVSALAVLVRNRVRPLGLLRLGLPSQLTGSGMAFPWALYRSAPSAGGWIVEDLLIGIELALQGHPPILCPDAQVSSALAGRTEAASQQRTRWEHGQLATLARYGPRLFGQGLVRGSLDLIALGLDLAVPPLALLVLMLLAMITVTSGGAALGVIGWAPATVALSAMSVLSVGVFVAWAGFGRRTIPLRYLLAVPLYLAWKLPLYLAFFFRGRERNWVRTERSHEPDDDKKPL